MLLLPYLGKLGGKGLRYYFQFTVNGYPRGFLGIPFTEFDQEVD